MPDSLEEERADAQAANSIDWLKLFPIDMSIDGSVQSCIQLLITISAAAKTDTILMAFFASHGTIIPAGARIYAASPADAAIDNAMRNVPTPSRDQAGKLIFVPREVVTRRLALATVASRPTPLARPDFSTVDSTPASSLSSHDNILPHSTDLPPADASGCGLAGPSLLDANAPDIMLSDPGAPADATALAASRRFPSAPDPFAAAAFTEFQAATRNVTLDPDMLAFGPPADDMLYSSPPAAAAPTAATTDRTRPAHCRCPRPAPLRLGARCNLRPPGPRHEPFPHGC